MVAAPRSSVAFLEAKSPPVIEAEPARIAKLLAELDDDNFAVRQKAAAQLEKLGESAAPILRDRLKSQATPEVRRRLEGLLATLETKRLRAVRGVEVLENIGTQEAKKILQKAANGASGGVLTQEAKASFERLARRAVDGR